MQNKLRRTLCNAPEKQSIYWDITLCTERATGSARTRRHLREERRVEHREVHADGGDRREDEVRVLPGRHDLERHGERA